MPQQQPDPKITVSVPVTVGGYTGQRDAWQQQEKPFSVRVTGDGTLVLESATTTERTKIMVPWATLQQAVRMVQHPQGPQAAPARRQRTGW